MKIKIRCNSCGNELILKKEDLKPLTKKEKEGIKREEKAFENKEVNVKVKSILDVFPFSKPKIKKRKFKELFPSEYKEIKGVFNLHKKFKCIICGKEQLI